MPTMLEALQQSRGARVLGVILGCLALLAAPLSYWWFDKANVAGNATLPWPAASGTLTSVDIKLTGKRVYTMTIAYTYTVEGATYGGNRVRAVDEKYSSPSGALAVLSKATASPLTEDNLSDVERGVGITAHYNPANPGESVLLTGAGGSKLMVWLAPVLFAGGGIWMLILVVRARAQLAPAPARRPSQFPR